VLKHSQVGLTKSLATPQNRPQFISGIANDVGFCQRFSGALIPRPPRSLAMADPVALPQTVDIFSIQFFLFKFNEIQLKCLIPYFEAETFLLVCIILFNNLFNNFICPYRVSFLPTSQVLTYNVRVSLFRKKYYNNPTSVRLATPLTNALVQAKN